MNAQFPDLETLCDQIYRFLSSINEAASEYDILRHLRSQHAFFATAEDNLQLFRQHFTIYHCLYRLQQELDSAAEKLLTISPLEILLQKQHSHPCITADNCLDIPDPLRTYYLDLENLQKTGHDDVSDMLANFWQLLARRDCRATALEILGLNDPVDDATIRKRYRQLVSTHHPDRGGDKTRLQLINAAMADLCPKSTQK